VNRQPRFSDNDPQTAGHAWGGTCRRNLHKKVTSPQWVVKGL
jgi:hypothetical protein